MGVVLALGGAASSFVVSGPAEAAPGPVVSIVSPVANQTVAGTVTVTASIHPEDTGPNRVLEVSFDIYGGASTGGGHQAHSVTISTGTCDTHCDVSATFDTKSFVPPTNSMTDQPNLIDGVAEFDATVHTAFGQFLSSTVKASIDNHRPSLELPDLPIENNNDEATWSGYTDLSTRVHSAVDPDGTATTMSSIRLFAPRSHPYPLSDVSVPAPTTGAGPPGLGTISFDIRHVDPGFSGGAYLVAFDSIGTASALQQVYLHIEQGFVLTSTRVIAATQNSATVRVVPRWVNQATMAEDKISGLALYNNGTLLGSTDTIADPHDSATVTVSVPVGQQLPAGDTTFTAVATDNHGVDRSSEAYATTTDPFAVAWSIGSLRSGSSLPIQSTITDTSHFLSTATVVMTADGRVIASAPVYSSQPFVLAVPSTIRIAPGRHHLSLSISMTNGQSYTRARDIDVYGPNVVTLQGPATLIWGHAGALTSRVSLNGVAQSGVPVQLQSRLPSATTWTARGTTVTGKTGAATFTASATSNARLVYRVVASAHGDGLAATSISRTVAVQAAFGRLPARATVRSGHKHRYSFTVRPARVGQAVTIEIRQTGNRWATFARPRAGRHGAVTFTERMRRIGRYQIRAVSSGTSQVVTTSSSIWTLRVRKA